MPSVTIIYRLSFLLLAIRYNNNFPHNLVKISGFRLGIRLDIGDVPQQQDAKDYVIKLDLFWCLPFNEDSFLSMLLGEFREVSKLYLIHNLPFASEKLSIQKDILFPFGWFHPLVKFRNIKVKVSGGCWNW